jgi:hypothetical protein
MELRRATRSLFLCRIFGSSRYRGRDIGYYEDIQGPAGHLKV